MKISLILKEIKKMGQVRKRSYIWNFFTYWSINSRSVNLKCHNSSWRDTFWVLPLFSATLASTTMWVSIILFHSWASLKACTTLMKPQAHEGRLGSTQIHILSLDSLVYLLWLASSALFSSSSKSHALICLGRSFLVRVLV